MNFDLNDIKNNIQKGTKNVVKMQMKDVQKDISQATREWSKPVNMSVTENDDGGTISIDDQRYLWVEEGTKPHIIKPRKAQVLRFLPGNRVRNEIARRRNNAAMADAAQYTSTVQHPGIKPRSITERILKKRRAKVLQAFEQMLEKAIKS